MENQCSYTLKRRKWSVVKDMFQDILPVILICGQPFVSISSSYTRFFVLLSIVVLYLNKRKRNSDIQNKEATDSNKKLDNDFANEPRLFPSITHYMDDDENSTAKSCSTGLTTRLLPFRNKNGDIEWAFTDEERQEQELNTNHDQNMNLNSVTMNVNQDVSVTVGQELDAFKIREDHHKSLNLNKRKDESKDDTSERNQLTPISSNSSQNDSIISKRGGANNQNDTPMTLSPYSENDDKAVKGEENQCPHCDASFKIRGYLTRHLKKHASKKAYKCPYYDHSMYVDENNQTHKCHPNGGFSRRDTYKTHLKSRHFRYPEGVKTKERSNSPGFCGLCNEHFPNAEIWSEIHVEGGECKYLPQGFIGKSRIKNRIRKQQQKQKLKGQQVSVEEATAAILSALTSPQKSPNTYGTPISGYSYNGSSLYPPRSNSPAYSMNSMPDMQGGISFMNTPVSVPSTYPDLQDPENYDYDDEYCLDQDQLVRG